jgi:hypothetical protein
MRSVGVALVAGSGVLALLTALVLRSRLAAVVVAALLTAAGAGIAAGGLFIRGGPSPAEIVATVVVLTILVPAHARVVLGPFGPRR